MAVVLVLKESGLSALGVGWPFPPITVTVYNWATIKGLIYPYYEYYSSLIEL